MNNVEIIEGYKDSLFGQKKSENTIGTYLITVNKLVEILNNKSFIDINMIDLQKYQSWLAKGDYSATYYNKNINALRSFVMYLWECDINTNINIDKFKAKFKLEKVDNKKKRGQKSMNTECFTELLNYIIDMNSTINVQRNKVIVLLALTTGIRREEIALLKKEDVDFENRRLIPSFTKGNKIRYIGLQMMVLREIVELWDLYEEAGLDGEYVILTSKNKPVHKTQINRTVSSVLSKAVKNGIIPKIYTPHALRKSFALWLYEVQGMDIKKIAELLGHESITTTEIYLVEDNEYEVANELAEINMFG